MKKSFLKNRFVGMIVALTMIVSLIPVELVVPTFAVVSLTTSSVYRPPVLFGGNDPETNAVTPAVPVLDPNKLKAEGIACNRLKIEPATPGEKTAIYDANFEATTYYIATLRRFDDKKWVPTQEDFKSGTKVMVADPENDGSEITGAYEYDEEGNTYYRPYLNAYYHYWIYAITKLHTADGDIWSEVGGPIVARTQHRVIVTIGEGGEGSGNDRVYSRADGDVTPIALNAIPKEGKKFKGWKLSNATAGSIADSNSTSTTFTMDAVDPPASVTITAEFEDIRTEFDVTDKDTAVSERQKENFHDWDTNASELPGKPVTIQNSGDVDLLFTITTDSEEGFTVEDIDGKPYTETFEIAAHEEKTFTIHPKPQLPIGEYETKYTIRAVQADDITKEVGVKTYDVTLYVDHCYPITTTELTGIVPPVTGAAPSPTDPADITMHTAINEDWSVQSVEWLPALSEDGKFVGGRAYTVKVRLKAADDYYTFVNPDQAHTYKINGSDANVTIIGHGAGNEAELSYTFAPTAPTLDPNKLKAKGIACNRLKIEPETPGEKTAVYDDNLEVTTYYIVTLRRFDDKKWEPTQEDFQTGSKVMFVDPENDGSELIGAYEYDEEGNTYYRAALNPCYHHWIYAIAKLHTADGDIWSEVGGPIVARTQHRVIVTIGEGGEGSGNDRIYSRADGDVTPIALNAVPKEGKKFKGWKLSSTTAGSIADSSSASTTFTMDAVDPPASVTITAEFCDVKFDVTDADVTPDEMLKEDFYDWYMNTSALPGKPVTIQNSGDVDLLFTITADSEESFTVENIDGKPYSEPFQIDAHQEKTFTIHPKRNQSVGKYEAKYTIRAVEADDITKEVGIKTYHAKLCVNPCPVTAAELTNVVVPVAGDAPSVVRPADAATNAASDGNFTVQSMKWSPTLTDGKFAPGTVYTLRVVLSAGDSYAFVKPTQVTGNGYRLLESNGDVLSVTTEVSREMDTTLLDSDQTDTAANTLTLTYTFLPTALQANRLKLEGIAYNKVKVTPELTYDLNNLNGYTAVTYYAVVPAADDPGLTADDILRGNVAFQNDGLTAIEIDKDYQGNDLIPYTQYKAYAVTVLKKDDNVVTRSAAMVASTPAVDPAADGYTDFTFHKVWVTADTVATLNDIPVPIGLQHTKSMLIEDATAPSQSFYKWEIYTSANNGSSWDSVPVPNGGAGGCVEAENTQKTLFSAPDATSENPNGTTAKCIGLVAKYFKEIQLVSVTFTEPKGGKNPNPVPEQYGVNTQIEKPEGTWYAIPLTSAPATGEDFNGIPYDSAFVNGEYYMAIAEIQPQKHSDYCMFADEVYVDVNGIRTRVYASDTNDTAIIPSVRNDGDNALGWAYAKFTDDAKTAILVKYMAKASSDTILVPTNPGFSGGGSSSNNSGSSGGSSDNSSSNSGGNTGSSNSGGGGSSIELVSYPVVYYKLRKLGVTEDLTAEKMTAVSGDKPKAVPKVTPLTNLKFLGWSEVNPDEVTDSNEIKLVDPTTVTIQNGDKVFYAVYEKENGGIKTGYEHTHYVIGLPNGTFAPNANITRGQVATMLARSCVAGFVEGFDYGNPGNYSDVAETWARSAISYCYIHGIMNGYEDGTFRPDAFITRQELVNVVARLAGMQEGNVTQFADSDQISAWAVNGVYTMLKEGWIDGCRESDGTYTFRPERDITRAETVKIFNRYLNRGIDQASLKDMTEYVHTGVASHNIQDEYSEYMVWPDVIGHWAYYEIIEAANDHDFHGRNTNKKVVPEDWTRVHIDEKWCYYDNPNDGAENW